MLSPSHHHEHCLSTAPTTTTPTASGRTNPFANTTSRIEVIRDHGKIDVEAEMRLYEALLVSESDMDNRSLPPRSISPSHTLSVYSKDIWLEDNTGASLAFTSNVTIPGWTSVGDQRKGAYIVYHCAINTKAGTIIHKHRRYNAFVELDAALRRSLPYWLSSVLLHPDIGASVAVKTWVTD